MTDKPTITSAAPGVASATISWSVDGLTFTRASGFRVSVFEVGQSVMSAAIDVSKVLVTKVTGLTPAKRYQFTVRALYPAPLPPGTPSDLSAEVRPVAVGTSGSTKPSDPTAVAAQVRGQGIEVTWTAPSRGEPFVRSDIEPSTGGQSLAPVTVAGNVTTAQITTLVPGLTYTFRVRTANGFGTSEWSSPSSPVELKTLHPVLPALSTDFLLKPDLGPELDRRLLASAGALGGKWAYEHLKNEALKAAGGVASYEAHISQLMGLALDKAVGAQQLLGPAMNAAIDKVHDNIAAITELGSSESLADSIKSAAEAIRDVTMLQRILAFLTQYDPLEFWTDLFAALIGDIARLDPELTDTGKHLRNTFTGPGLGQQLRALVDDLLANLDAQVDLMVAPLRDAIGQVVAGTNESMDAVFASFDMLLTARPSGIPGGPSVPNANPLADVTAGLDAVVDQLAADIRAELEKVLRPLSDASDGGAFFEGLMRTYVVLPLAAFLVIGIAGGPPAAAALAAIVLIGAQALIALLTRWLTGPLQGQVDAVQERVRDALAQVEGALAREAQLLQAAQPEDYLEAVSSQLQQLAELMPHAFLEDAANLLTGARDVVLRSALQLSLAAERALGEENATAFDALPLGYDLPLTRAPQLPGGDDASRLAGAALIRDLGRLEQERALLNDGKETEITIRHSLVEMLGSPERFADFVRRGEVIVEFTHDALDERFPGIYRALIKEVEVEGVLGGDNPSLLDELAVSVTHLGTSATRIHRAANPAAPPLSLPDCLPSADDFLRDVLDPAQLGKWFREAVQEWKSARPNQTPTPSQLFDIARSALPEALIGMSRAKSCDLIDGTPLAAAAREIIDEIDRNLSPWVHLSPQPGNELGADLSLTTADVARGAVAKGRFDDGTAEDLVVAVATNDGAGNDFWVVRFDKGSGAWRPIGAPNTASFGQTLNISASQKPTKLFAVGDVDGDGRDELIAVLQDTTTQGSDVFVGDYQPSSGTWSIMGPTVAGSGATIDLSQMIAAHLGENQPQGEAGAVRLLTTGDVDGDGVDEIIINLEFQDAKGDDLWVVKRDPGTQTWVLLAETPSWRNYVEPAASIDVGPDTGFHDDLFGSPRALPSVLVAADVDGDGRDEVVVAVDDPSGQYDTALFIYGYDTTTGSWRRDTSPFWVNTGPVTSAHTLPGRIAQVVVGDYDGDGRAELALTAASGGRSNDVVVLDFQSGWWNQLGRGYRSIDLQSGLSTRLLIAGDFDGDGKDELAMSMVSDSTLGNDFFVMTYDKPTQNFVTFDALRRLNPDQTQYQVDMGGVNVSAVAGTAADVNGDGRDELIAFPLITKADRDARALVRMLALLGSWGQHDIGPESRADDAWVMTYRRADTIETLVEELVVAALRNGAGKRKGLLDVAARAHRSVVDELTDHIAKWGEADLREERDHHVGSLGYASLVRWHEPETTLFNLAPDPTAAGTTSTRAVPLLGGATVRPGEPRSLQYRPFENFGYEGQLLVSLASPETTGSSAGPGASVVPPQLLDLVLKVTVRACHDHELASTVRSSRQQRASMIDRGAATATGALLGTVPSVGIREGGRRTVRLSLRAHRDEVLRAWLSAVQAASGTAGLPSGTVTLPGSTVKFDASKPPLGLDAPFTNITTGNKVEVRLATTPVADLGKLEGTISIDPSVVGVALGGGLVELGIAVIPFKRAGRRVLRPVRSFTPLTLEVNDELRHLLPGFQAAAELSKTLVRTPVVSSTAGRLELPKPVAVAQFIDGDPLLTIDLGSTPANETLYDVIISLTFMAQTLRAADV